MCIRDFLRGHSVRFEVLLHRPAHSATHLAGSIHVPGRQVAKAVLVRAGDGFALAVLPCTHRVDTARLASVLGVDVVEIAGEEDVVRIFADCEAGALPPFGHLYGLTTVVDSALAGSAAIAFVANTRHEGVRMRFKDYEAIESPLRARFATPIDGKRKAG